MYGATLLHPLTTPAAGAAPARRVPHTGPTGALVLALAWSLLAGSFLVDVARPPRAVGAWEARTGPGALASARPALPPCTP
jgi:hypothetical protein